MIVLDTGAVFAFYDRNDRWHAAVQELFETEPEHLVLPASIIPEVDYLLGKRLGQPARMAFIEDLILGVYLVYQIAIELYPQIQTLDLRYSQLDLGFVDASVMALAQSIQCSRIATLDQRHFVAVARELKFELLP